uniref:Uncharacterized protein n=1 Tax=Chromera velia CCMP2878 TaxID=1169474 RepID=A0A0G4HK71_9ALVE|eukprot:Cvel_7218.t1-p1 / transcript=Cvel_7218.t1 / gene=Cvel_7218 / organism=Chromera_velia_CCMP2878 / gene_product=hypothetical protein / transcript_product=hypothetical protein / location=Cvel_scaffold372:2555-8879(+) / protein_length=214 / sequence_SO=supercontig / SO=protein_coding / is_pseudo=false
MQVLKRLECEESDASMNATLLGRLVKFAPPELQPGLSKLKSLLGTNAQEPDADAKRSSKVYAFRFYSLVNFSFCRREMPEASGVAMEAPTTVSSGGLEGAEMRKRIQELLQVETFPAAYIEHFFKTTGVAQMEDRKNAARSPNRRLYSRKADRHRCPGMKGASGRQRGGKGGADGGRKGGKEGGSGGIAREGPSGRGPLTEMRGGLLTAGGEGG